MPSNHRVLERDGDFAPLAGTADFSSSGGVFVSRVETHDADDAERLTAVMEKNTEWIEGLDLGAPKGGKSVEVELVLLVALE